jgi:hypothetical protein
MIRTADLVDYIVGCERRLVVQRIVVVQDGGSKEALRPWLTNKQAGKIVLSS